MGAYAVIAVLGIWQGLLIATQLPKFRHPVERLRLKVFPAWPVFRGRLTTLIIYYRDLGEDGTPEPWKELSLDHHRGWFSTIWNPESWRVASVKAMLVTLAILVENPEGRKKPLEEYHRYKAVEYYIRQQTREPGSRRRQFRILRSWGHIPIRSRKEVFVSQPFPL